MVKNQYPGWNLDLRWTAQEHGERDLTRIGYPMGIHYNCYRAKSEMLLVRGVAMMLVMDRLTDKPDWHPKVFDEHIADKWRHEALAWPNSDLWNRISQIEPWTGRSARYNPRTPKNILSKECVDYCILELRDKAAHFKRTGITPTLDATFSIAKSDVVVSSELRQALRDAFARLKAHQASNPNWHPNTSETVQDLVHPSMYPLVYGRSRFLEGEVVSVENAIDKFAGKGDGDGEHPRVTRRTFTDNGGVQFTSYINNLHPTKYRDIYKTIEALVQTALPMWDQCLARYNHFTDLVGAGRHKPLGEMLAREAASEATKKTAEQPAPSSKEDARQDDNQEGEDEEEEVYSDDDEDPYRAPGQSRWERTREPVQLEPPAFASNQVNHAIKPAKTLREQFKDSGLQIIVKIASIELTPEKPATTPCPGLLPSIGWVAYHGVEAPASAKHDLDALGIIDKWLDNWTIGQQGEGSGT
ncbi:hypothetical protein B0T24DRAFT_592900 [Lasiosphaeria ovina]|uniref:Uncharacterized protein n=1 Tax=Lasiosphaeria ovina TaxID=92902 RepID=A0AAE0KIT2_9PEZI|nr:hypothetical protein B0T24DRAFT_592900 [Lasiosphaeria ovina]